MFESAFQDGVKRPGTREMTAMLAGLMALNAFAIDGLLPDLTIACGTGAVKLTSVQREGKSAMDAATFLRGAGQLPERAI